MLDLLLRCSVRRRLIVPPAALVILVVLLVGPCGRGADAGLRSGCPTFEPMPTTIPKPDVIYLPSTNFGTRSNVVPAVDSIVMHTTEVSLQGTLDIFLDPANSVSSHYVIASNGDIYEMVAPEDRAWHATYYNSRSIGIEMVGYAARRSTWNDDNLGALVDLLAWLYQAYPEIPLNHPSGDAYDTRESVYNQPGLVAHSQVQPWNKSDPGVFFPWDDVIEEVGIRLAAAIPEPSSATSLGVAGLILALRRRRVTSR